MILDKETYMTKEDWTTTSHSGIKYCKRGNVVQVQIVNASFTAGTTYTITGLPTPINSKIITVPIQRADAYTNMGYISYNVAVSNAWGVVSAETTNYDFCSFTYLTDE